MHPKKSSFYVSPPPHPTQNPDDPSDAFVNEIKASLELYFYFFISAWLLRAERWVCESLGVAAVYSNTTPVAVWSSGAYIMKAWTVTKECRPFLSGRSRCMMTSQLWIRTRSKFQAFSLCLPKNTYKYFLYIYITYSPPSYSSDYRLDYK